MSAKWRPIVLYQPRGPGLQLPLALVALGSLFHGRRVELIDGRVELAPEACVLEAVERAACLAVSVPSGPPILDALRISQVARDAHPDLTIVWGGWHPTFQPEQCLASGRVDACVRGQGEPGFSEIVAALDAGVSLDGVAGVVWSRAGELIHNAARRFETADRFPRADYSLLDLERYFRLRGVRRLDYCSSRTRFFVGGVVGDPSLFKQRWSGLSSERVVEELHDLVRRHRPDEIAFSDEGFLNDPERVGAICRGLLDAGVQTAWRAFARPEHLEAISDAALGLLRESGCRRLLVWADLRLTTPASPTDRANAVERLLATAERLHRLGLGGQFCFVASGDPEAWAELRQIQRAARAIRKIAPKMETPVELHHPYPGAGAAARVASGFVPPRRLEEWAQVGPGGEAAWIPQRVLRRVSRFNFYLRRAHRAPEAGTLRRLLRWTARARVKTGFYGLDVGCRLTDLRRRWSDRFGAVTRPQPED